MKTGKKIIVAKTVEEAYFMRKCECVLCSKTSLRPHCVQSSAFSRWSRPSRQKRTGWERRQCWVSCWHLPWNSHPLSDCRRTGTPSDDCHRRPSAITIYTTHIIGLHTTPHIGLYILHRTLIASNVLLITQQTASKRFFLPLWLDIYLPRMQKNKQ